MDTKKESPKINSIAWGKIITADGNTYKDAKLFPGGSREWDWNETGTRHSPGTQPTDVEELITHGAQQVILSQGYHQRLGVCQETTDLLTNKGITFYILETSKAVKKYNSIRKKYPTGALIHSTC
ncbi:MAG: Mth938-like domain-containing protein [Bacteroidota bacterium]